MNRVIRVGIILYVCIIEIHFAFAFSIKSSGRQPLVTSVSLELVPTTSILDQTQDIILQETNDQRMISDTSLLLFAARVMNAEETTSVSCQGILLQEDVEQNPLDFTIHISSSASSPSSSSSNQQDVDRHNQLIKDHVALGNALLQRYLEIEEETMAATYATKGMTETAMRLQISFDSSIDPSIVSYMESIGIIFHKKQRRLPVCLSTFVPFLHQYAFHHRGTNQGTKTLLLLQQLCQRRIPFPFPFPFDSHKSLSNNALISLQKQILSPDIVQYIMQSMERIKANDWLSTNPDSVDGIASLHVNLISGGKELFQEDVVDNEANDSEFSRCISNLTKTIKPYLDQHLLPTVRELTQSNTVEISDVFLRHYGKDGHDHHDENDDDDSKKRVRYKLSSHYDITSFATCVMALDDTAMHGTNGLYTVSTEKGLESTNHAALRQFFPLKKGDGVIHTYDVLHGVDVHPSLNQSRTSLIVWFVDPGVRDDTTQTGNVSLLPESSSYPWLLHPKNDVHEFILALASDYDVDREKERKDRNDNVDQLYIKSCKKGNSFALNAMAQRIEDGIANMESKYMEEFTQWFQDYVSKHGSSNPFYNNNDSNESSNLSSQALWYESAMLGNVNAQISLADDIMMDVMMKVTEEEKEQENEEEEEKDAFITWNGQKDRMLMASVLFTMANVQGVDVSSSLKQILSVYMNMMDQTRDDWEEDEVVQTLLLTL